MRFVLLAGMLCWVLSAPAQIADLDIRVDTDHDGLSDAAESALLAQFAPRFMVSDDDCSRLPAQFVPLLNWPEIEKENGTIYGQAFPSAGNADQVELHYYHLWRRDCGEMSHPLDAEHVSALVVRDDSSGWKALYWYAAAHEDTVCDASQIARATAVDGEIHGPVVWISRGKHASFLNALICARGCGGDKCRAMEPLSSAGIVNLGERSNAMNGAVWADSPRWPLSDKMVRSDFSADRTGRVDGLPATSIAWANPDKRPMQAAILGGNGALAGAAAGFHSADTALDVAGSSTGTALGGASGSTSRGLTKAMRGVKKAWRATTRKLGVSK